MDPRTNERIPVSSSEESLDLILDGTKTDARKTGGRRVRACPVVALLALFVHMISSGCGIALSALIVRYGLDMVSTDILNLVARILVFAASCMGPFYVFMHLVAAREHFVRSQRNGTGQIFGNVSVAVAVLVMRLGLPVWIAAVVLSALLAAQKGFDVAKGFEGNVVWVQLIIASLALLSLIILIIVTEITERPFATSIFSRRSFIKGMDTAGDRRDTFGLSIPQQGRRPGDRRSRKEASTGEAKPTSFEASTVNSPESPELTASPDDYYFEAYEQRMTQRQTMLRDDERLRRDKIRYNQSREQGTVQEYPSPPRQTNLRYNRPRSQFVPEPLESVYTVEAFEPKLRESPSQNGSHFSWRPPTRDSTYSPSQQGNGFSRRPSEVSTVLAARISIVEPASQPPTMPLPPMPLRETPDELSTPTSRAFVQERPSTAPERSASPVSPSAVQAEPPPSLAQLLSALSTRAAARRRNSLVVRQAELAPVRESLDMAPAESTLNSTTTAILFPQPDEDKPFEQEVPRRTTTARDLMSENGEPLALRAHPFISGNTTSGMIPMVYEEPNSISIDQPATTPGDLQSEIDYPLGPRELALQRLVTNFSRPRLPGIGSEYGDDLETEGDRMKPVEGRTRANGWRNRTVRRSRSLPTLTERPWASRDTSRPAPAENGSQFGDSSNVESGGTPSDTVARADEQPTTAVVTARAPRFSPFPRVPLADPEKKIKGLGQGSTRRRDERIARWREEVQADDSVSYQE